jgi:hypothetical protein
MYEINQYLSHDANAFRFRAELFWVITWRVMVISQKSAVLVYFAAEA